MPSENEQTYEAALFDSVMVHLRNQGLEVPNHVENEIENFIKRGINRISPQDSISRRAEIEENTRDFSRQIVLIARSEYAEKLTLEILNNVKWKICPLYPFC